MASQPYKQVMYLIILQVGKLQSHLTNLNDKANPLYLFGYVSQLVQRTVKAEIGE